MKKLRMYYLLVVIFITVASIGNGIYAINNSQSTSSGLSTTEAVEIASTIYGLKQGETLVLDKGYYQISGQAYLQSDNITIKGAGKDKTFIYVNSEDAGWGITITGSNCSLQDFTLQRSTKPNNAAAIKVMGGHATSIKNIKTIGGYYGIDVNPSIGTVIDGCEFTENSKAAIGIGCASSQRTTVTIQNTTTGIAGWHSDVAINDGDTYGRSSVTIGEGNRFKNGTFYTENYSKGDFLIPAAFPKYKSVEMGQGRAYTEIPGIQLQTSKGSLEVGKKRVLSGIVSPANEIQSITWESLNPNIATISDTGEITAISSGQAEIKAIAGEVTSIYVLTVFKTDVSLPSIDVTNPTDIVDVGIIDTASKETINETTNKIIESIINSDVVDASIISIETTNKVKEALGNGASISTKVETKIVDEALVDNKDKEEVNTCIKNIVTENRTITKVAQYLDIDVLLQSQKDGKSEDLGAVYQLNNNVAFAVAIPTNLKKADRNFYVVRIHNGISTVLPTIKNEDGTISFETNQFSTYALLYNDNAQSAIPTPPTPTPDDKEDPTPTPDDKEEPVPGPADKEDPTPDLTDKKDPIPGITDTADSIVPNQKEQPLIHASKQEHPSTSDTTLISGYILLLAMALTGIIKLNRTKQ